MSPLRYVFAPIGRAANSFHPRAMPLLARGPYRREILAWVFLPIMLGTVEGGVVGVIVRNAFDGRVPTTLLNLAVAVITGAPAFANVTSFVWGSLSHGRHKVDFLVGLQLGTVAMVTLIAFAPLNAAGLVLFVVGVVGARVCWTGVAALRTTIWRANYARGHRARVTGKFATAQSITIAATGMILGAALDENLHAFRVLYPLAAVCGFLGTRVTRGMRVRGHVALLQAERRGATTRLASLDPRRIAGVLLRDRPFAFFMACQFVLGIGNMMTTAPLIYTLRERFGYGNLGGVLVSSTVPIAMMPLSIPLWARLLDATHIVRFRSIHSWCFVVAAIALAAGAILVNAPVLWLAVLVQGVAYGGGVLAWNLGHHDFAPPERAAEYMGVHMTLTGLRGLIAPLLAWGLWEAFDARWPGGGPWVFAVAAAFAIAGATGFVVLARALERGGRLETPAR